MTTLQAIEEILTRLGDLSDDPRFTRGLATDPGTPTGIPGGVATHLRVVGGRS